MKKYKLRQEVLRYFTINYRDVAKTLQEWADMGVHLSALKLVNVADVSYGAKIGNGVLHKSTWSSETGGRFSFSINFPYMDNCEYNKFGEDNINELIDVIQRSVDTLYIDKYDDDEYRIYL